MVVSRTNPYVRVRAKIANDKNELLSLSTSCTGSWTVSCTVSCTAIWKKRKRREYALAHESLPRSPHSLRSQHSQQVASCCFLFALVLSLRFRSLALLSLSCFALVLSLLALGCLFGPLGCFLGCSWVPLGCLLGPPNRPKIDQNQRWSEKCRALRLGSPLGGVLEASWRRLGAQHSSKLATQIEGKSIKNQSKNRSKNRCLPSSNFDPILMEFWRENGGMLAPKSSQKSMSTSKGRFCKKY